MIILIFFVSCQQDKSSITDINQRPIKRGAELGDDPPNPPNGAPPTDDLPQNDPKLPFTPVAGSFIEENGLIIIEAESGEISGEWALKTEHSGFSGSGYMNWAGPDMWAGPATEPTTNLIRFKLEIKTPGIYKMRLHHRGDTPVEGGAVDHNNDVFTRMGLNKPWIKTLFFGDKKGAWTREIRLEPGHHVFEDPAYDLGVGVHQFDFLGRSHNYSVDRIGFYLVTIHGDNPEIDLNTPESARR
ncbi:MAG: hypothetical protein KBD78_16925 [Oligoflexales bacterium]|nr:hypothetical protein [Oligoflexales bacterium]